MKLKKLYRLVNEKRQSYDGFQWPGKGGTITAPDWDPDPTIECGRGLHAGDIGDFLHWDNLDSAKGYLQEIVFIGPYVRSLDDRKYRGKTAVVLNEYEIPGEEARKIFLQSPEWAYAYGLYFDRGPRDDAREAAMKDPIWGGFYAKYIDEESKKEDQR